MGLTPTSSVGQRGNTAHQSFMATTERNQGVTSTDTRSGSMTLRSTPILPPPQIQLVQDREQYITALNEWAKRGLTTLEQAGRVHAKNRILIALDEKRTDLNLRGLNLSQVPPLWMLSHVTRIDLAYNQLSRIDENAFSGLGALKKLYLEKNGLLTLSERLFSELSSLEILFLSGNLLQGIPDKAFGKLTSLRYLDLSDNRLQGITLNAFSGLTSLTTLRLSNNVILTIDPKAFDKLLSLKELDLSRNYLVTIPEGTFSVLTSLNNLNLESNSLSTITEGTLSVPPTLRTLNLHENPNLKLSDMEYYVTLGNVCVAGYKHPKLLANEINRIYLMAGRPIATPLDWNQEGNSAAFLRLLQGLTKMDFFTNGSTKAKAYSSLCDHLDKIAFSSSLRSKCFTIATDTLSMSPRSEYTPALALFKMQIHAGYIDSIYTQTGITSLDRTSKTHFYNLAVDLAKFDCVSKAVRTVQNSQDTVKVQLVLLHGYQYHFKHVDVHTVDSKGMRESFGLTVTRELEANLHSFLKTPSPYNSLLPYSTRIAVINQLMTFPEVSRDLSKKNTSVFSDLV